MLIYDVFYYDREGRQLAEFDSEVSENYLDHVRKHLRAGERAYARCLNNPEHDVEIVGQPKQRSAKA